MGRSGQQSFSGRKCLVDSAIKATRLPLAFYFASESAFLLDETRAWLLRSIFLKFWQGKIQSFSVVQAAWVFLHLFTEPISLQLLLHTFYNVFFMYCVFYSHLYLRCNKHVIFFNPLTKR